MKKPSRPSLTPSPASAQRPPASGWRSPEPGDVLSYSYLWHREAEKGQEEGLKDRPVVVVLAVAASASGTIVHVAPVTHAKPDQGTRGIEMPPVVKRDLALDRERSWIIVDELNRFVWPGPDVRPIDGGDPIYGAIPDWLLEQVQAEIGALHGRRLLKIARRTE